MLIGSLAAYVKRVAPAAPGALVDEYGSKLSVWLNLLADDQGYAASGRDCDKAVEQRIEAATTWGTFFGVDTKHVKSWFSLGNGKFFIWLPLKEINGSQRSQPCFRIKFV